MIYDPRNLSSGFDTRNVSQVLDHRNVSLEEYLIEELGPKHADLTVAVSMTLVYALLLITGVIGNVCTCVVISRNKYMHTATNYYLFSLAVSDLLLLVLGLPQEIYQLWVRYPYIFGEAFCIFRGLTSETSTNASILTITAFTVERYVAICHPLKAHTMSKLTRAIKFIVGIWCLGAVFAIPVVIQLGIESIEYNGVEIEESRTCALKRKVNHAFEISTGLFFILPMTLISILYVLISVQLRRTSIHKSENKLANGKLKVWQQKTFTVKIGTPGNNKSSMRRVQNSRRAVIKMLVAVVVAFFLCWAPFHAQRLMAIYVTNPTGTDVLIYTVLTYISGVTYYVSATINPILYSILSVKFRQAFKETLARCCRRRGPRRDTSYSFKYQSTVRTTAGYEPADLSSTYDSPRRRNERILQYSSPNKIANSKSSALSFQRPQQNGNKTNHITS